jgi:hypothetical protein
MSLLTSGIQHHELKHNLFARLNRFDRPLLFTMGDYFHIEKSSGDTTIIDNVENDKQILKIEQNNVVDSGNFGSITARDRFIVKGRIFGEGIHEFSIIDVRVDSGRDEGDTEFYGDLVVKNYSGDTDIENIFELIRSTFTANMYKNTLGDKLVVIDGENNTIDIFGELVVTKQISNVHSRTITSNQSSITLDLSTGHTFLYTMGDTGTSVGATNLVTGAVIHVIVKNVATGGDEDTNRTIDFNSPFRTENAGMQTIGNGETYVFTFICDGSNLYQVGKATQDLNIVLPI